MKIIPTNIFVRILIVLLSGWVSYKAGAEFYQIAWGSGIWLGQFSFKWALAFFVFVLFCVFCFFAVVTLLWSPHQLGSILDRLSNLHERLSPVRWVLAILILIITVWLLQYTSYGAVLYRRYLRILLWGLSTIFVGLLLARGTK